MAIGDYLRVLRRLWWVIVVVALLGAGGGYLSTLVQSPKYQSTAQLFVTTQNGTSVGDAYQNNLFSSERVKSYAGLATSRQVAARAVAALRTSMSADDLRSKISAAPVLNTVLLNVSATDHDAAASQRYANAVAAQLVAVVGELETSRRGGTPAAGAILVDEADYPSDPTGMGLITRIGLGAAAGFAVGIILVIIAGFSDRRVRSGDRVAEATGATVLGTLIDDPRRETARLADLTDDGPAAERLRELRTNLQFSRLPGGRKPTVIAVTSPGDEEDRSSIALDLATIISEAGRSVVLVEGNLVSPQLSERLGVERRSTTRGLTSVLAGEDPVSLAVIDNFGDTEWAFLPAGPVPSARGHLWAGEHAFDVIAALRSRYEYVIIDTPPLSACADGAVAAALGDGALILTRLGQTTTTALERALQVLTTANASVLGAVVTGDRLLRRRSSNSTSVAVDRDSVATARDT